MVQKLLQFINYDIWRLRSANLSKAKGLGIRALRTTIVSIKQFGSDRCGDMASALTYYSLLSIVPVFAMAFGFAKGFGMEKGLKQKLLENMEGQEEVIGRVISFAEAMLESTKGGLIAGVGILLLFWTVIKVLGNIERAFNLIWGVKKHRPMGRKFADYLSLMLICPVLFILGSSITVFISSQVTQATENITILSTLGPVITLSLKLLPYMVFWGLLTYIYSFMPNTKVNFKSALIGGIVAGTVYQLVQWAYIHFQVGVSKAGAIYGSFAALPLFLVWLQMSWMIVLYGAELSFAHQNQKDFEFEPDCRGVSLGLKKLLALRITQLSVHKFCEAEKALTSDEIAEELETPVRLTREVLHWLTQANILVTIQGEEEKQLLYQPARDVEDLTIKSVLDLMDQSGSSNIPIAESPELQKLRESLETFSATLDAQPSNLSMKNLQASFARESISS